MASDVSIPARKKRFSPGRSSTRAIGNRLVRLLSILHLTGAGRGWSAARLASQQGISKRRLYQDLALLRQAGFPVISDGIGYRPLHPCVALPVRLSIEEILAVLGPGRAHHKYRSSAQVKLAAALPAALGRLFRDTARVGTSIAVTACPPSIQAALDDAILEHRRTRIRYCGLNDRSSKDRTIEPHAMFLKGTGWYIVAWCCEARDFRLFRLDRIESAQTLIARFSSRPEFKLESYLDPSVGVWTGGRLDARVEVFPSHLAAVRSEAKARGLPFQLDGGKWFLEIPRGNLNEFAWWLAQFGEGIRVIEPSSLKHRLLKIANRIVALHSR